MAIETVNIEAFRVSVETFCKGLVTFKSANPDLTDYVNDVERHLVPTFTQYQEQTDWAREAYREVHEAALHTYEEGLRAGVIKSITIRLPVEEGKKFWHALANAMFAASAARDRLHSAMTIIQDHLLEADSALDAYSALESLSRALERQEELLYAQVQSTLNKWQCLRAVLITQERHDSQDRYV